MKEKSIIRIQKRSSPYVQIDKSVFTNQGLTWKAKGILGYLLSRPDDWKVYVCDLVKQSKDGKDAVYSGLKELENNGYLKRCPIRDKGKIIAWETIIFETPQSDESKEENPVVDKSHIEKTNEKNKDTENPPLLITEYTEKENTKKEDLQINNNSNNSTPTTPPESEPLSEEDRAFHQIAHILYPQLTRCTFKPTEASELMKLLYAKFDIPIPIATRQKLIQWSMEQTMASLPQRKTIRSFLYFVPAILNLFEMYVAKEQSKNCPIAISFNTQMKGEVNDENSPRDHSENPNYPLSEAQFLKLDDE